MHSIKEIDHTSTTRAAALIDTPPIVVFGTGGSGTRVVAQILEASGCYMGGNLNHAHDNQDFGFLLAGRIKWMERHFPFVDGSAEPYIRTFKKLYFKKNLSPGELLTVACVGVEYLRGKNQKLFRSRPLSDRLEKGGRLLKSMTTYPHHNEGLSRFTRWGFKVPEALYFLRPLSKVFPQLKVIHLLRDGRDVALSSNQKPSLYRHIFNLDLPDSTATAYENWSVVNRWARDCYVKNLKPEQVLTLRFEDICKDPRENVDKILEFSGLTSNIAQSTYGIPRMISSIGRWKKQKDVFKGCDQTVLKSFGYE